MISKTSIWIFLSFNLLANSPLFACERKEDMVNGRHSINWRKSLSEINNPRFPLQELPLDPSQRNMVFPVSPPIQRHPFNNSLDRSANTQVSRSKPEDRQQYPYKPLIALANNSSKEIHKAPLSNSYPSKTSYNFISSRQELESSSKEELFKISSTLQEEIITGFDTYLLSFISNLPSSGKDSKPF